MHPVFPRFRRLTLEDKDEYNRLVARYTPFSDFAFTTLHIWWDLDEKLFYSILNGNLVLNYSQPFDVENSGLCLIGHDNIDDSLEVLFDYLKKSNIKQRLVHVPEFVVEKITSLDSLEITEETDMHEYVMSSKALAELEGHDFGRIRRKVNRFLREVEGHELVMKRLELNSRLDQDLILNAINSWQERFPKGNDLRQTENSALQACLRHHEVLETRNLCLFIDGELHGVILFHQAHDGRYYIINHLKVDYSTPFIFDFLTNQLAVEAVRSEIPFLNMEMDLGIEGLRQHKQGLRPVAMLKKYTISNKG